MRFAIAEISSENCHLLKENGVSDRDRKLIAEYGGSPSPCQTCYLTVDALGSTRSVFDQNDNPVAYHDYLPYGAEIPAGSAGRVAPYAGADLISARFTGKERDSETGLDNFLARYLSSAQGRFMGADQPFNDQDPLNPQSWNLYAYGRNNPLSNIDPNGKECVQLSGGFNGWGDDGYGTFCNKVDTDHPGSSINVGVGRDEANLIMLQGVGDNLSSTHQWADLVSKAGQDATLLWGLKDLAIGAWDLAAWLNGGRAAASAAGALAKLGRPSWADTPGGFLNWLKNLQRAGTKLTAEEADAVVAESKNLNVDVRLDPPHPGTNWDKPHLNVGKEGQVHLEVPSGYDNASVPKGSVRKP